MNKSDFLKKLAAELQEFDVQEQQNVLDFYMELIEDKMDSGLNEAEAVKQLDSPEEIVKQLKQEREKNNEQEKFSFASKAARQEHLKNAEANSFSFLKPLAAFTKYLFMIPVLLLGLLITCCVFGTSFMVLFGVITIIACLLLGIAGISLTGFVVAISMFVFFILLLPKSLLAATAHLGGFLGFFGLTIFSVLIALFIIIYTYKAWKFICLWIFKMFVAAFKLFFGKFLHTGANENKAAACGSEAVKVAQMNGKKPRGEGVNEANNATYYRAEPETYVPSATDATPSVVNGENGNGGFTMLNVVTAQPQRKSNKFILASIVATLFCFSGLVIGLAAISMGGGPLNLAKATGYRAFTQQALDFEASEIKEIDLNTMAIGYIGQIKILNSPDDRIGIKANLRPATANFQPYAIEDGKLSLRFDYETITEDNFWEFLLENNYFGIFAKFTEDLWHRNDDVYLYIPESWTGKLNVKNASDVVIRDGNFACETVNIANSYQVNMNNVTFEKDLHIANTAYLNKVNVKGELNIEAAHRDISIIDSQAAVFKAEGELTLDLNNFTAEKSIINLNEGFVKAKYTGNSSDYSLNLDAMTAVDAIDNDYQLYSGMFIKFDYFPDKKVGIITKENNPDYFGEPVVYIDNQAKLLLTDPQLREQYRDVLDDLADGGNRLNKNYIYDDDGRLKKTSSKNKQKTFSEGIKAYLKACLDDVHYSFVSKAANGKKSFECKVKNGYIDLQFGGDGKLFGYKHLLSQDAAD